MSTQASPAAPAGAAGQTMTPAEPALIPTLTVATASQVMATASVLALASIPTLISLDLGIPAYVVGYQVSLIYFSGIFASAMAGGLVKRLGSARVSQIALYCAGIGFLGLASGLLVVMVLASVLIGIGYGLTNPPASHILRRVTPSRLRNLVYSIKQAGVPLGGILVALAIPPLTAVIGWRLALLTAAIPALALAALFYRLRPSWDTDRLPDAPLRGHIVRGQRAVWSAPGLPAIAAIGLLYSALQLCVTTFAVAMLVTDFGWNPVAAGTLVAAVQACGAVGRIVWGVVADIVRSGFLVLAFLGGVTALCCLLMGPAMHQSQVLGIVLLCVLGACAIGWNGVLLAETTRLSPGPGTLTGEVLVYTFLGVMVGPSTFAAVYSGLHSYTAAFAIFGLGALAGAVIGVMSHFRHLQRRAIADATAEATPA